VDHVADALLPDLGNGSLADEAPILAVIGMMLHEENKGPRTGPPAPQQPPVHKDTTTSREVLAVVGVSTGLVLAFLWFMGVLG
jgi:hypothetical protein